MRNILRRNVQTYCNFIIFSNLSQVLYTSYMSLSTNLRFKRVALILSFAIITLVSTTPASASPFGQGVFGADVPFGSMTSLAINLGGDVALPLTPNGANFSGTNSHIVTVTSTDVVGYYLYAHTTGSSDMTNGTATIPASSNSSLAPLSVGTWGYNTTGSTTNFLGMGPTSVLLTDANGPYKSGNPTTVTYGVLTSSTQPAGNYTVNVTYTAVAKNQ